MTLFSVRLRVLANRKLPVYSQPRIMSLLIRYVAIVTSSFFVGLLYMYYRKLLRADLLGPDTTDPVWFKNDSSLILLQTCQAQLCS